MPANRDAWDLWIYSRTQVRSGGMGPIGLDYPAVWQVADILGIPITPALLNKIRILEMEWLKRANAPKAKKEGGTTPG